MTNFGEGQMALHKSAPLTVGGHPALARGIRRYWRAALALTMLLLAAQAWAGPNVLLLWDDDDGIKVPDSLNVHTKALVRAMETAGISVTFSARTQGRWTGFNPMPNTFDAVVHLNGGGPNSYILSSSAVTRLTQYVRNEGGAYVGSENNAAQMAIPLQFGGLSTAMWDLTVIDRVRGWGVADITVSKIAAQSDHPVLRNLPDSFVFRSGRKEGLAKEFDPYPALALMRDGWGNDAVSVREFGVGRIVAFHHTGNTAGAAVLSNANIQRLYINAVLWGDTKVPSVVSVDRADATPSQGGTLRYTARFSEGVTGVDSGDFAIETVGEVSFTSPISVRQVSTRQYEISIANVTGAGTIGLKLNDNDSIRDRSYNKNPLGGQGLGNANFVSPTYTVDSIPPALSSFTVDYAVAPLGSRPTMSLVFSKTMDQTRFPAIAVTTKAGHVIGASSVSTGGDGFWVNNRAYQVSLDRPVISADEGIAAVAISNAVDLLGNVMLPDETFTIALIRGGLRIVRQPPPAIYALAGDSYTFTVQVADAAGPPQYEWFKEDIFKIAVSVGTNAPSFTIKTLDFDDTGIYFCVITDAMSVIQSTPAAFYVVEAIPARGVCSLLLLAIATTLFGVLRLKTLALISTINAKE